MHLGLRYFLTILFVLLSTLSAISQTDKITNSFEEAYKSTNPNVAYSYDNDKQVHNYSSNWDLDGDGKPDEIYFVGTGGAHLYFFLRVVLSTNKIVKDFNFIQSDFPILPADEYLKRTDFNLEKNQTQFAVLDIDKDGTNDIFIRIDNSTFQSWKKILNSKKVMTKLVVLTFKDGKEIIRDYNSH